MNAAAIDVLLKELDRYRKRKALNQRIIQYFEGYEAGLTQARDLCVENDDESFRLGLIAGERDRELLLDDGNDR